MSLLYQVFYEFIVSYQVLYVFFVRLYLISHESIMRLHHVSMSLQQVVIRGGEGSVPGTFL